MIIGLSDDERRSYMGNESVTVGVHSTMHLVNPS